MSAGMDHLSLQNATSKMGMADCPALLGGCVAKALPVKTCSALFGDSMATIAAALKGTHHV